MKACAAVPHRFSTAVMWVLAAWTATAQSAAPGVVAGQSERTPFQERVDVARILVDVRVLDDSGQPVADLTTTDFAATIDGKAAVIDTVEWVAGDSGAAAQRPGTIASQPVPNSSRAPSGGRWIVLLYQKHSDLSDVEGMMRLRRDFAAFAKVLRGTDHVAVLSFDTRLRLWVDFTNDVSLVTRVLNHEIFVKSPPVIAPGTFPSLAASTPTAVMARTHSVEESLKQIGDALAPLPGAKSIVILGFGMGTWVPAMGWVEMAPDYGSTLLALQRARVSVFSVDVTRADYHAREEGLRLIAEDTGGFYMNTHIFTTAALDHVAGALAGYYALFVVPPDVRKGTRRIEIRLSGRKRTILSRRVYVAQ